jgi:periplasmic divalent cation tolerance protein
VARTKAIGILFLEKQMSELVIFSTADSEELARNIASALVEEHEAACVNIIPGMTSIYRWEGKICDSREWLLLIKAPAERFEAVRSRIRAMHTYQLPEVIAVSIEAGDPEYLEWVQREGQGASDRGQG